MNELLTPAEMGEVDRLTVQGIVPLAELVERAGTAVADVICAEWPAGTRVLAVCGPGNNGWDGRVAARILAERGLRVAVVYAFGEPASVGAGNRLPAWMEWSSGGGLGRVDAHLLDRAFATAEVVIDALFGAGLRPDRLDGDDRGVAEALIVAMNRSPATVYAVDLPSGVMGATGEAPASAAGLGGNRDRLAVEAERTITFQRKKPGHLLMPGRLLCGRLTVADIGIPDHIVAAVGPTAFENGPALWRHARPRLDEAGHKFDRGHVAVVSGPVWATGAARLAATAAARAGAGLVTVASPPDALLVNAMHLTSVMVRKVDGPEALAAFAHERKVSAVAIGPGLPPDEHARAMIEAALTRPAVLDAGALMAFAGAGGAGRLAALVSGACVLTPHPGEFARLFPDLAGGKLVATRAAAAATGAVVLHKGADTVIAAPDGRAAINANAPAWLATAGAGDVLAGIVAAFLGQGVAPFEAAAMGAWLHGDIAQRAGPALIAEDLLAALKEGRAALDAV